MPISSCETIPKLNVFADSDSIWEGISHSEYCKRNMKLTKMVNAKWKSSDWKDK